MKKILILIFWSFVCLAQAQNLSPESKKGLFGYKKAGEKRWIIKPKFQDAKKFGEMGLDSSLAFVKQNNLWGVINQKGVWQIGAIYDSVLVKKYNEIPFIVTFNKATKMLTVLDNKAKKQTIDFENEILNFDVNKRGYVILTQSNNNFLYQIANNQFVETELKNFQTIEKFNEKVFLFEKNGLRGLFLHGNKPVLIEGYTGIWKVYNQDNIDSGYAIAFKGTNLQKIALNNLTTENLGDYDIAEYLYPNIFFVSKNNKKGLVSENGEKLLPIEYDEMAYMEFQGYNKGYKIKKNGLLGIFDNNTRKIIIEPIYQSIMSIGCPLGTNIYLLLEKDNKKYLFSEIDRKVNIVGDNIFCLQAPTNAFSQFGLIIIQNKKKVAILENFSSGKTSNFYDKIVIERSKVKLDFFLSGYDDKEAFIYDLVGYNGSQKTYINPETFEISKKPLEVNMDVRKDSRP